MIGPSHQVCRSLDRLSDHSAMRGAQAQVGVGNAFSRGAWWQNLFGGQRDFTFGICASKP